MTVAADRPHPSSDAALLACTASAWAGDPKRCRWCDGELTGRRTRWCRDECANEYARNHWWSTASVMAKKRDGWRCVECGSQIGLEAHHLIPVLGRHGESGCHHHLEGLVTLCADCHLEAHRELRERERAPKGQLEITTTTEGDPVSTTTHDVTVSINGDPEVPLDDALFNGDQYATPVPKLDGHRADTLKLTIGGTIEIDPMDGQLLDWFKSLRFGQDIELRVTGTIGGHAWTHRVTDPDSGQEKVTHARKLVVHSIETDEQA